MASPQSLEERLCQDIGLTSRHLERMPLVSGREGYPDCHPERSEGSREPAEEILRCAQDDSQYLQMSNVIHEGLTLQTQHCILYTVLSIFIQLWTVKEMFFPVIV